MKYDAMLKDTMLSEPKLQYLFRITEKLLFSALCSDQSERQDADMPFPPWGGGERCCL